MRTVPPHIVAGRSILSSIRPAPLLAAWMFGAALGPVTPVAAAEAPKPITSSPAEETAPSLLRALEQQSIDAYRRARQAVVAIDCRLKDSETVYYGSGVVVTAHGMILTGQSVVPERARAIRIRWADGHVAEAEVLARDESVETVVLALRKPPETALPFIAAAPAAAATPGARVFAAGNPHRTLERDGEVYWSAGALSGRYEIQANDRHSRYHGPVLETDAAVNFGCDGGPLLDANGRLLGLLSLAGHPARQLGVAVPLARIRDAFAEHDAVATALRPVDAAAAPAPLADLLRRQALGVTRAVVRIEYPAAVTLIKEARPASDAARSAEVRFAETDPAPRATPAARTLSGVLVEPRGTVLTCASLLPSNGRVDLTLPGGERMSARVLGRDEGLDVAVLVLDRLPDAFEPLPWPEADEPPVAGHWLAVLGAPLGDVSDGAEPTLTLGMVSAAGRLSGRGLQVDALVNAGNAGGPVMDLRGRLVGVVTQQDPRKVWGQNSGVGFVAPATRIRDLLPRLRAGETIPLPAQAFLGVRPAVGETAYAGVKLAEVLQDTAAWQAGLRGGDIVTALDGEDVRSWPALVGCLKTKCAGQRVEVRYLRGARAARATVVLDPLPAAPPDGDE